MFITMIHHAPKMVGVCVCVCLVWSILCVECGWCNVHGCYSPVVKCNAMRCNFNIKFGLEIECARTICLIRQFDFRLKRRAHDSRCVFSDGTSTNTRFVFFLFFFFICWSVVVSFSDKIANTMHLKILEQWRESVHSIFDCIYGGIWAPRNTWNTFHRFKVHTRCNINYFWESGIGAPVYAQQDTQLTNDIEMYAKAPPRPINIRWQNHSIYQTFAFCLSVTLQFIHGLGWSACSALNWFS